MVDVTLHCYINCKNVTFVRVNVIVDCIFVRDKRRHKVFINVDRSLVS